MVGLIVVGLKRSVFDRHFVAIDADEGPDLARVRLPQPCLAPEEAVLAFEILRRTLLRFVLSHAPISGTPREVWTISAIIVDAQQQ